MEFLPGSEGFLRRNLQSITNISTELIVSCLAIMLWAASWMFTVIEKALNRIYGSYPRSFLHGRAVNFAVMVLVFVLLGASSLLTAFMSAVRAAADRIPVDLGPTLGSLSGYAWQTIFVLVSLALTISLFTVLYKILPNTSVPLAEALWGAVLAGVLFEGAKFGFAAVLPYFSYELLYGSIGAAVALLSWVYLSSVIMLFGAQFTALLHRDHLFKASLRRSELAVTAGE
jgi:membrane protein